MKNNLNNLLALLAIVSSTCFAQNEQRTNAGEKKKAIDYVNPFIGTADATVKVKNLAYNFGGGNTFPGAVTPWGMTAISPRNTIESFNKDDFAGNPSGYIHGREYFYGFSQIHLSGVGCNEWGNILVMPTIGSPSADIDSNKSEYTGEAASPGYYKVYLRKYGILAEVSSTTRSTITKYTLDKQTRDLNIVFDLYHAIRAAHDGSIRIVSDSVVEGWNQNGGFCGNNIDRKVFFAARFSKRASEWSTFKDGKISVRIPEQVGATTGSILRFSLNAGESLYLKIGVSFVSIENAVLNLDTEQPDWDFEKIRSNASEAWETVLSRVKVEGGTEDNKTMFYTALYHALIHPSICSDINGDYRAMGSKRVKRISGKQKNEFNVFSLWDTYRNLHPFLTLVYPEMQIDMIRTMVNQANENGYLPKWELSADETYVMVGDPACIVIADAFVKGLTDFDAPSAFNAMIKSSTGLTDNKIRPGIAQYLKLGFIPQDNPGEWVWGSVSTSLEYYMADFAISQFAKALGKKDVASQYWKRSLGYKNYFDPQTTFLRPKNENGGWSTPFNPDTIKGSIPNANFPCGGIGYTEGNAWQYTFFVPHDIDGLKELMGEKKFVEKLKACFDSPERFVLFNEPDMAYPYLFTYVKGSEYFTQEIIRKCIDMYFANDSGGLPGNDDCGTTSAWFLFSALGFYPACPATTCYQIGTPLFDRVTIQLNSDFYKGENFVIETQNNSKSNLYITGMKLNGRNYNNYFLDHSDIVAGGVWTVSMGEKPLP